MTPETALLPSKQLTCLCVHCKSANAPFKVEYLFGHMILLNAICASCETRYWISWDLLKLQMDQDEKEVEAFRAAMKLTQPQGQP